MKRQYNQPIITVIEIDLNIMIAGSPDATIDMDDTQTNTENYEVESRTSNSLWDEEW